AGTWSRDRPGPAARGPPGPRRGARARPSPRARAGCPAARRETLPAARSCGELPLLLGLGDQLRGLLLQLRLFARVADQPRVEPGFLRDPAAQVLDLDADGRGLARHR